MIRWCMCMKLCGLHSFNTYALQSVLHTRSNYDTVHKAAVNLSVVALQTKQCPVSSYLQSKRGPSQ